MIEEKLKFFFFPNVNITLTKSSIKKSYSNYGWSIKPVFLSQVSLPFHPLPLVQEAARFAVAGLLASYPMPGVNSLNSGQ